MSLCWYLLILQLSYRNNMEYKQIKLQVLRAPDGEVTCVTEEGMCKFYREVKWGQISLCAFTEKEIKRKSNSEGVPGMGYTIPTDGCPLKDTE